MCLISCINRLDICDDEVEDRSEGEEEREGGGEGWLAGEGRGGRGNK